MKQMCRTYSIHIVYDIKIEYMNPGEEISNSVFSSAISWCEDVFIFNTNRPNSQCVAESLALASLLTITSSAEPVCVQEEQSVAKEPLPTTHNVEGRHSCTCREEPEIGPSLGTSERQLDYSGFRKLCGEQTWRKQLGEIFWRYTKIGEYLEEY